MTDRADAYHSPERDTAEWNEAWDTLSATGRDLDDYMLMHITARATPGGRRAAFKHRDTREYVHVTLTDDDAHADAMQQAAKDEGNIYTRRQFDF